MQIDNSERMEVPEKKAWQALHGAWGKRPAKQAHYNAGTYPLPDTNTTAE